MTRKVSSGFSRNADPALAAKEAYEQALSTLDSEPHSAWVFCSHHHYEDLPRVRASVPVSNCIAGTAYGAVSNFGESEEEPGLSLLLIASPELTLRSNVLPYTDEPDDELDWGRQVGRGLENSDVLWLLLSHRGWAESIAEGLANQVPRSLIAGGGLCGPWPGPTVLAQDRSLEPLLWGVGIGGTSQIEWTLSQALAPLEGYLPVEGLVGDRVQRLGGMPAIDMARRLLGEQRFESYLCGDLLLYARTPGGESGRADRLFAVPNGDSQNGEIFIPGIPESTTELALAIHNGEAARKEFAAQLADLKERIPNPTFGVYLNCCGRGQDLYGELNVDAEAFAAAFPGVPMAGLSVGFELAPRPMGARLCSYTGILILIR